MQLVRMVELLKNTQVINLVNMVRFYSMVEWLTGCNEELAHLVG